MTTFNLSQIFKMSVLGLLVLALALGAAGCSELSSLIPGAWAMGCVRMCLSLRS